MLILPQKKEIQSLIRDLYPEIVQVRRTIHQNPELSGREYKTAQLVYGMLQKAGYKPKYYLNKTAVIAKIKNGKSARSVILRADMDALPIEEKTGLSYCSKNKGVMHACGHDMHTSILLGVAQLLKVLKNRWLGSVYLLFQPSEEIEPGGAFNLISCGALPPAESIFGLHVNTDHYTGSVGVREGLDFSGVTAFDIVIKGRGGHGATPEVTIDPLVCASTIILQLQTLISREISPFSPVTLTIGEFKAGSIRNIIPDEASMYGTIRCHSRTLLDTLKKRIEEMVSITASSFRAKAHITFLKSFPPTNNDSEIASRFSRSFEQYAGKKNLIMRPNPSMYAEDFAFYQEKMKGLYIHLGVRPRKGKFNECGLHSASFTPDEAAIATGMLAHVSFVFSQLGVEK